MVICKLSRILGDKRLTYKDVHEATGISVSTISYLRRDMRGRISFETLDKLCKYLDCQPGDLLIYEPDPEEDEGEER